MTELAEFTCPILRPIHLRRTMNTTAVAASFANLNEEIAASRAAVEKADRTYKSVVAFTTGFAVTIVPAFMIANRILTNRAKNTKND